MGSINYTTSVPSLGPIKRPFKASTNRNIHKTLKQSVTSSRMKPLPHGVCRNSSKPESTRCPRRVEQLSFLLRRNPTVGSPGILEKRYFLSLKENHKTHALHLSSPPPPPGSSQFVSFLKEEDVHFHHFSTHATCVT